MTSRLRVAVAVCSLVAYLCGCGLIPRHVSPAPSIIDNKLAGLTSPVATDMETDFSSAWAACTGTSCDSRLLLLQGMNVIDNRCGTYFRALGQYAQQYAYGSKQLSLTGGAAAAIEGLTGVAAKAISITGSTFAFGAASAAAYQDTFVFSPDVASVENLVKGAQDAARKALVPIAGSSPGNRDDVGNLLRQYEKTCEVQTIRNLVNQSINVAKVSTGPSGAPVITSAGTATFVAGTIGTHTVTATGNPAPTFLKANCPAWASLDSKTGILTANPAVGASSPETCAITAQNGVTPDASQTLTMIVNPAPAANTAPTISAFQVGSFNAGQVGSFTVAASGSAPLTFSKGADCPAWVNLDVASGRLYGTASGGASSQTCTVTVMNASGHASQGVTIAVNPTSNPMSTLQLHITK